MIRWLLALVLICGALPAGAHEFWINKSVYKSLVDNTHCCGVGDCKSFVHGEVDRMDGGWLIVASGEVIPDNDTQTSEDNFFWRCQHSDGSRRCFFAPLPGG